MFAQSFMVLDVQVASTLLFPHDVSKGNHGNGSILCCAVEATAGPETITESLPRSYAIYRMYSNISRNESVFLKKAKEFFEVKEAGLLTDKLQIVSILLCVA